MDTLREEFRRTIAAEADAFPDKLSRLVVALPSSGTPVYVSPEVAAALTEKTDRVKKEIRKMIGDLRQKGFAGVNYPRTVFAGEVVGLIAFDTPRGFFSKGYSREMWRLFVLDHELGHRVVRNGSYRDVSVNHAESAADAHAMLRHIQRYGNDTNFSKNYGRRRASSVVLLGDTGHYTEPAVRRAVELSRHIELKGLSLETIADLAAEIADETAGEPAKLNDLREAFLPVWILCRSMYGSPNAILTKLYEQDPDAYDLICRKTLEVMKDNADNPDVQKVGKDFLTGIPPVARFMKKQAETNSFWQEAQAFLGVTPAPAAQTMPPARATLPAYSLC